MSDKGPNLYDRVVGYFSPRMELRNVHARNMLAIAGGYRGARRDRRQTKNYRPGGGSADADILPDLPEVRERSRDLVRNVPLAGAPVGRMVTNVVGRGLRARPQIDREALGMTRQAARVWERKARRYFNLWASRSWCDMSRTATFAELQDLVYRSMLESGDNLVFLGFKELAGDPFGLKLQVYEGDQISTPQNRPDGYKLRNGRRVFGGVEVDRHGAPEAYWLQETHPGAIGTVARRKWRRIQARGSASGRVNALHIYKRLRPGAHRGVPFLAPVIEALKMLGDYTDAEVMAAVVSSCFTITTETASGTGLNQPIQEGLSAREQDDLHISEPGQMVDMRKGEVVKSFDPGRPNASFDPFVQAMLRQIGAVLEIPFEVLLGHFTRSYSAARAALLEAWRFFRIQRQWLAVQLCQPIYEAVLFEAIARGRLEAPGFIDDPMIRAAYCGCLWIGDPQGQLDPLKETNAAEKRIDIGLTTLEQETMELTGGDFDLNHDQRVYEHALRHAAGLTGVAVAAVDPVAPETEIDDDEKEKDDDDDD